MGKTFLYDHCGGAKAVFCYVNIQVNNDIGEALPPVPPAATCLLHGSNPIVVASFCYPDVFVS